MRASAAMSALRRRIARACTACAPPTRAMRGAGVIVVLAAAACASSGAPSDAGAPCPNDLPASCPTPAPSYAQTIAPLLQRRCFRCHGPGGSQTASHDFTTYDKVYAQRSAILNQVYGCAMPPPDAEPLTADERAALLGWLVCHAPND